MLEHGKWIAHNPSSDVPGFGNLSQLYSYRKNWGALSQEFLKVYKIPERYKTFVNTVLGETWKETGERPEWKRLSERRETWKIGTVPAGGLILTAGIDVQGDRIEVQVKAWGRNRENWTVDYQVLVGRTTESDVWARLNDFMGRMYPHERGGEFPIARAAIDTGHNTQEVYGWVRAQGTGRVIAVKGYDSGAAIINAPKSVDIEVKGKKKRRAVKVWTLNVSMLKEELYGWLQLERPTEKERAAGQAYPGGYCHFPQLDDEFFQQMTAEQLVTKLVKGYRHSSWQKMRERNEALDTHNYARAAVAHMGYDRWTDRDFRVLESSFVVSERVPVNIRPVEEAEVVQEPVQPAAGVVQASQPPAGQVQQQPYQRSRPNFMRR